MKYKVHLIYRYTYACEVEANSEQEALDIATNEAKPEYDCMVDAKVKEIKDKS